jgi:hypothetical protein
MDVDVTEEATAVGLEDILIEGTLDSQTSSDPKKAHTGIINSRHNKPKKANTQIISKGT